ncbi:MAG: hypothetical protein PHO32_08560, partial [Candidatus Cloacimonetes bacterium]|nr:hypothetical protein [Candidatus Cloacimonadota bacterium]
MSFYNVTSTEYAHFYNNYIMGTDKQPEDDPQTSTTTIAVIDKAPQAEIESEDSDWTDEDTLKPVPVKGPAFKERSQSDYIDLTPPDNIPYKYENEARLYGQFCSTVLYRLEQCESRVEEWKRITEDYNGKELISELYALLGKRNERCLRLWLERYLESNRDMFSLVHKNKNQLRGRKVTYIEQNYLLNLLLNPNNIKVGSAISSLKDAARMDILESPSSAPTLKRWCNDWELSNKAIWTQARSGSKAVAESIVKTIIRDASLLNVGDVWVADGHNLAFDIMNPKTGKA